MKSLYQVIKSNIYIDGHIHLFDKDGIIDDYDKNLVGFIDIEAKYINDYKNVIPLYDKFIKNNYDEKKHILLAAGTNINNIKELYNKYPKLFKGFGELKCYDVFKGNIINRKNISFVDDVCKFSESVGYLPVYIHYSLTRSKYMRLFENLLKKHPNVPIVLCHCGMEVTDDDSIKIEYNNDYIYNSICELMREYSNLWVDITYTAADYFIENIYKLYNLDLSRTITGSDINNVLYKNNMSDKIKDDNYKFNILAKYIPNNIPKLFKS